MTNTIQTANKIAAMIRTLESALELAQAISSEFADNGTDSLANIDYGAALNTELQAAVELFRQLDDSGIFTMGEE